MTPLLEARGISVRFGGVVANDAIDVDVQEGSIDAIVGPNGAGKTTLFNVLSGAQRVDSGRLRLAGEDVTGLSRLDFARRGVARTFQNLSLSESLTCLDNVAVGAGRFHRTGPFRSMLRLPAASRADRAIRADAMEALAFVGIQSAASRYPRELPYGDRRRVELARALLARPRLLLMDEPAAGMEPGETGALAAYLRLAARTYDITILVVEHDISFVRELAARTTVIDFGRVIATGPTAAALSDPLVIEAYLGGEARAG